MLAAQTPCSLLLETPNRSPGGAHVRPDVVAIVKSKKASGWLQLEVMTPNRAACSAQVVHQVDVVALLHLTCPLAATYLPHPTVDRSLLIRTMCHTHSTLQPASAQADQRVATSPASAVLVWRTFDDIRQRRKTLVNQVAATWALKVGSVAWSTARCFNRYEHECEHEHTVDGAYARKRKHDLLTLSPCCRRRMRCCCSST